MFPLHHCHQGLNSCNRRNLVSIHWTGLQGLHYNWVKTGLQGLAISDSKVMWPLYGLVSSSHPQIPLSKSRHRLLVNHLGLFLLLFIFPRLWLFDRLWLLSSREVPKATFIWWSTIFRRRVAKLLLVISKYRNCHCCCCRRNFSFL